MQNNYVSYVFVNNVLRLQSVRIRNIINIIMLKRDIPPILNLNTYRFVYFKHNYIFIDYIIPNLKRIETPHYI